MKRQRTGHELQELEFHGIRLKRWQWDQFAKMLRALNHGAAKIGMARFISGGVGFEAFNPFKDEERVS